MLAIGEGHADYVSSGILSKKIKEYNDSAKEFLPYLKSKIGEDFTELNTEGTSKSVIEAVRKLYEPTIVHIKQGPDTHDLKKEITEKLQ